MEWLPDCSALADSNRTDSATTGNSRTRLATPSVRGVALSCRFIAIPVILVWSVASDAIFLRWILTFFGIYCRLSATTSWRFGSWHAQYWLACGKGRNGVPGGHHDCFGCLAHILENSHLRDWAAANAARKLRVESAHTEFVRLRISSTSPRTRLARLSERRMGIDGDRGCHRPPAARGPRNERVRCSALALTTHLQQWPIFVHPENCLGVGQAIRTILEGTLLISAEAFITAGRARARESRALAR